MTDSAVAIPSPIPRPFRLRLRPSRSGARRQSSLQSKVATTPCFDSYCLACTYRTRPPSYTDEANNYARQRRRLRHHLPGHVAPGPGTAGGPDRESHPVHMALRVQALKRDSDYPPALLACGPYRLPCVSPSHVHVLWDTSDGQGKFLGRSGCPRLLFVLLFFMRAP